MQQNRDFKGVWIPREIWLDKNLTLQEKIFYVEIDSLDDKNNIYKGCFASNDYFSEFFGISKTRVSIVIKKLIEKGYITSSMYYKEGTKQILKRVLNISYRPYQTNVKGGYTTKVKAPIKQKLKDNNTSSNTNINNTYYNNKELNDLFVDFLNLRGKLKAKNTERAINMLIKELSNYDDQTKIKMIEKSIMNSWKGVFPLKQQYEKPKQEKTTAEKKLEEWDEINRQYASQEEVDEMKNLFGRD